MHLLSRLINLRINSNDRVVNIMAIEIEKKYRLDKRLIVDLTAKLAEVGAEFISEVFEENFLHRGGTLDERSAALRIRKVGDNTTLTYKEKLRDDNGVKHKIEYETDVTDAEALERIIEMLGYHLSVVYEKHRKTWKLGDVEVVLDELPFGLYMEIEGTIEAIAAAEKLLGAKNLEVEPRGYPSLTVKLGKTAGNVSEARFEKTASA